MSNQSVVYSMPLRATGTAYLWWFFLGGFGAHKFYLGRPFMGIAYIFTLGFLGFGHLYDLFTLHKQVRRANDKLMGSLASTGPSKMLSSADDPSQLTDAEMDAMFARYAAQQRSSQVQQVASPYSVAPATKQRVSFGKRR